ncbi:DNA endonuclease SmrA [Aeromonas simiae]|uniref:DNA endonuclease SmrA n=1 Tax=Aeromonas simiae TaxID=218936 RepID=UPI00266D17BA|nr:DNA endonuclease SmrA [Aeromonas simiae]MDO2947046.1 DNA endonuclease SmrA [Aeromonas simiae]MDO2950658.1 DNA endonuclease SmrA [Aeromonas simiae]
MSRSRAVQPDDYQLFMQEMSGVKPITSDQIPPSSPLPHPSEAQLARREAAMREDGHEPDGLTMEAVEMLRPSDPVGFKRDGVQEGVYKKLRLGKYELQASLDLHQHTLREARVALLQFIRDCLERDIRSVLILHGKGERSQPQALLKSYVSAWLPHIPEVMAMHSAERRHGGSGALYVLLRKSDRKKAENRERHLRRLA